MKIAIIGSGISGLTAAYLLNREHDVVVYEANSELGGHTATKTIEHDGASYNIDTGFIVFNDWTYPNFIKLLREIDVPWQDTSMGFSVFYPDGNFEYAGNNLNTLFSQRKRLFDPKHWRMITEILRFNRESLRDWQSGELDKSMTLGQYLKKNGYGETFKKHYLLAMGSAIWSASTSDMEDFPLLFFIRFFHNHGLLNVINKPVWKVISGGSKSYIGPLTESFKNNIKLASPVHTVLRTAKGVEVHAQGSVELFDQVVLACHSDQALELLGDSSADEHDTLGAIRYRKNDVVLHTDTRLLPKLTRSWSSWNYCMKGGAELPVLTYNMNILQGIESDTTFCVTLNAEADIEPTKILGRYQYAHPVFNLEAINAQERWQEINGVNKTWFCGAYWMNGFHEDGVNSALRVAKQLGVSF